MSDERVSLEDLLRAACESGVTHLTLYPVPSQDGKTTYWEARGTPSTNHKYVNVADTDPVRAFKGMLLGLPKARRRAPPGPGKKSRDEHENDERARDRDAITAAVTATTAERPAEQPPAQETFDQWLPKM